MAACPNSRKSYYRDVFTGISREFSIPCGHCASCLHNISDSWTIRLLETSKAFPGFIYDTLTLRDKDMEWKDISDYLEDASNPLTPQARHYLFDTGYKHARPYDHRVPILRKQVLSDWIKRGRERMYRYYKRRGKDLRPKIKYLLVLEYGPKWSRPHVHLLMFGLTWWEYMEFFGNPWKERFGFTKTSYIRRYVNDDKSTNNISRYVSKYINKGCFESDLVKLGLQPPTWRMVSNGIGEEYLESPRFKFYRTMAFDYLRHCESRIVVPGFRYTTGFYDDSGTLLGYKQCRPRALSSRYIPTGLIESMSFDSPVLSPSLSTLQKLITYVDDGGYSHPLPRYYRYRLLGRSPNFAKSAILSLLYEHALERRNKEVSRIATGLERSGSCEYSPYAKEMGLPCSPLDLASLLYDTSFAKKALVQEARYFSFMKNHYNRSKSININNSNYSWANQ